MRSFLAWLAAGAASLVVPAFAQPPAPATAPAPQGQAQAPAPTRVFGADSGLVLNFIKPDKTADFEAVMAKLREALATSSNPIRKQQGESWRVYKAAEAAAGGAALYVYVVDPPVKDADYSVTTILAETFSGDELKAIIKQYTEAYATGQNFVNLKLLPVPEK